jgi:serine/threonine protein kinase
MTSTVGTRGAAAEPIDRGAEQPVEGVAGPFRAKPGARIGSYRLVRCIGQGGTAVVYEAVHAALGRRVALKILQASRGSPDAASSGKADQRFLREGRAAAQVRHPHVVDVYDFGVADGLSFLVMELVEGESLAQLLRREGKLPLERAVDLLLPIASATAELHAAGIVHRDIKPGNILLARGPTVCPKLADFGVSRFDDGTPGITDSGTLLGTLEYLAPELIRAANAANEWSDQYSLGVTLYECVAGERPFRGASPYQLMRAIVENAPTPLASDDGSPLAAFYRVVLRAL